MVSKKRDIAYGLKIGLDITQEGGSRDFVRLESLWFPFVKISSIAIMRVKIVKTGLFAMLGKQGNGPIAR
jgi:hypothetical protein